jgi:hypothetical protein
MRGPVRDVQNRIADSVAYSWATKLHQLTGKYLDMPKRGAEVIYAIVESWD